MNSTRLLVPALVALLSASPAAADVTLKSKASGKGIAGGATGDMTQYVKGTRTRTDQTTGGRQTSTIIDVATQKIIVLDHERKQADVMDMAAIGSSMAKAGMADLNVSITPTSTTREIAGTACTVYDVKVVVPMQMGNGGMTMVMTGPQCLAKNGPGHADFMAFYKAASAKGFFLDPNQAKAQPAVAKAMADMQRQMAELGVPLATEMTIAIDAGGAMAEMMKKMSNTITTEVTSISTAAIPDAMFEVPADYKVAKR